MCRNGSETIILMFTPLHTFSTFRYSKVWPLTLPFVAFANNKPWNVTIIISCTKWNLIAFPNFYKSKFSSRSMRVLEEYLKCVLASPHKASCICLSLHSLFFWVRRKWMWIFSLWCNKNCVGCNHHKWLDSTVIAMLSLL